MLKMLQLLGHTLQNMLDLHPLLYETHGQDGSVQFLRRPATAPTPFRPGVPRMFWNTELMNVLEADDSADAA